MKMKTQITMKSLCYNPRRKKGNTLQTCSLPTLVPKCRTSCPYVFVVLSFLSKLLHPEEVVVAHPRKAETDSQPVPEPVPLQSRKTE